MLRAQKPLHLRQAEERGQKPLRDLVGEQTVAVLHRSSKRRTPSRRSTARRTSEKAGRTPTVRPVAAPSEPNKEATTAPRAAIARAGWTDGRTPRKAPKTLGRVQPAPHWSRAASIAADVSQVSAPRRPHSKTAPRSSDLRRASGHPRFASPTPANHTANPNSRAPTPDFSATC